MDDLAKVTRDHYQAAVTDQDALLARVDGIVDAMGDGPKTSAQLAGLDQFHVGGLAATTDFASRIDIVRACDVLDAGCGLGGPARYLAETFGCRVTGVDLTPSYVAMANRLTEHAGLSDRVTCQVGDLTSLDLGDATFDLVWTQHVAMNIRDRQALYTSLRHVTKPGGRLAFYDALATDGQPEVIYPTPWAQSAETSTVLTEADTRAVLGQCGFEVTRWDDVSTQAGEWLARQRAGGTTANGPAIPGGGASLFVGPRIAEMAGNFFRNLAEGRLRLVMAVCQVI
jgi:SAM-dependent methyltransferase